MSEPRINWAEKRASKRIAVTLPLLVRGRDRRGVAFEDTTASYNVSRDGASFSTPRQLEKGQIVEVVIPRRPMGRQTTDFETQGRVVRVSRKRKGEWEIGLQFIGPRLRTYVPETV